MMTILIASLLAFGLAMLGLSLGVLAGRAPLAGSCGGACAGCGSGCTRCRPAAKREEM